DRGAIGSGGRRNRRPYQHGGARREVVQPGDVRQVVERQDVLQRALDRERDRQSRRVGVGRLPEPGGQRFVRQRHFQRRAQVAERVRTVVQARLDAVVELAV